MDKEVAKYVAMPHEIHLQKQIEGDNIYYFATIPELAGCMSDGNTIKDAIRSVMEAKEGWIETVLEEGHAIPYPKNQSQVIYLLVDYDASDEIEELHSKFYEVLKQVEASYSNVVFINLERRW